MRKTKIICTIGPASESEERLKELMLAGMDVARFNFSHGTHEEHKMKFSKVVKVSNELNLPVATMMDTKGPEIRLRDFEGGKAELVAGQKFILTMEEVMGDSQRASVTYKNLKNDIKAGMSILIDDGLIEMVVEEIKNEDIVCAVVNGGTVSDHKGVNVPNAILSMPYINDTDREDIIFACETGYDFIAASFARCREDILEVRKILEEHKSTMKVIAKIENMQGIQNLEEILSVSDGIMVARGDMGVEIPLEEVPVLQKKMIKMAEAKGKFVITATQMLESMIRNPRPTRAEATDIANAIYDGTTAIMLSGETAAGQYPVEAVKTMARIAGRSEQDIDYTSRMYSARYLSLVNTSLMRQPVMNSPMADLADSSVMNSSRMESVLMDSSRMEPVVMDSSRMESVPMDSSRMESVLMDSSRMESVPMDSSRMESVPMDSSRMNLSRAGVLRNNLSQTDETREKERREETAPRDVTEAISYATCTTAANLHAAAIVTVTMSGFTAGMISRYKPACPIIACTVDPKVYRQLNLLWGVVPILIEREENADSLFGQATRAVEKAGYVKPGDVAVLTAGVPLGISGTTNMVRVIEM